MAVRGILNAWGRTPLSRRSEDSRTAELQVLVANTSRSAPAWALRRMSMETRTVPAPGMSRSSGGSSCRNFRSSVPGMIRRMFWICVDAAWSMHARSGPKENDPGFPRIASRFLKVPATVITCPLQSSTTTVTPWVARAEEIASSTPGVSRTDEVESMMDYVWQPWLGRCGADR